MRIRHSTIPPEDDDSNEEDDGADEKNDTAAREHQHVCKQQSCRYHIEDLHHQRLEIQCLYIANRGRKL